MLNLIFLAVFITMLVCAATWAYKRAKRIEREQHYELFDDKVRKLEFYFHSLCETKDFDWDKLISINKSLKTDGVLPANCDVDKYGMLRAESVEQLSKDNIYLGGIYGLWTFTINDWMPKNTTNDNKLLVWRQYKDLLRSNIQADLNKFRTERNKWAA